MSSTLAEVLTTAPAAASEWVKYPTVYEINTWTWLADLSDRLGKQIELSCVPSAVWDEIGSYGFDAVWLMGVWERSPSGIAIANQNQALAEEFRRALPDFGVDDNVGSPYCVRRYVVDQHLGGPRGLAIARQELAARGVRLLLDFVPNHVAPDHPWVGTHPEFFIQGTSDDAKNDPSSYLRIADRVFACGRDPYFPAWPDVLQLNAFSQALRRAASETVSTIAQQCDGVRCDMAMLLMNKIFERTWSHRAGPPPATEYWVDLISTIKKTYPNFLFIAEAYWNLEWELQQLGFDFCYDKTLYDRLEHSNAESIRLHLCADLPYQQKLVRFIENHDEPRAAATFLSEKHRTAAVTAATLPGLKLFHEGQFEGRTVRLPVFLGRHPLEPVDHELQQFYKKLIQAVDRPVFREGQWSLCERTGWQDNTTFQNIVAWTWLRGDERYLIVVNVSDRQSQARVSVPWAYSNNAGWHLRDVISGTAYERDSDEMYSPGLYVDLGPWQSHFFQCDRVKAK